MNYLIQNEGIKDLEIAEDFKLIDINDVKKDMYYISEDGEISHLVHYKDLKKGDS